MYKLLHFSADWCIPCKKSQPIIDEFLSKNNIEYQKIDIDKDFHLANIYNVKSIPTFISLKNTEYYDRHTGIPTEKILNKILNQ
jgi:thioredoxin 1